MKPAPRLRLSLQQAAVVTIASVPGHARLRRYVMAALTGCRRRAPQLMIRIVGRDESARLNGRFRSQPHATNVLSFPSAAEQARSGLLGDIVLCAPVIRREAREQGKHPDAHWAHMVVHGVLHLRGYDHAVSAEAHVMESLETRILTRLGFPPPYET